MWGLIIVFRSGGVSRLEGKLWNAAEGFGPAVSWFLGASVGDRP